VRNETVTHSWFHIAKAEFLVQTAGVRHKRWVVLIGLLLLGIVWGIYIAPSIMSGFVSALGPSTNPILIASLPGFMRSSILTIWIMLMITPLSYGLQEIKVSQWEIMLSNKVSTRDIIVGTFIAKIPIYGLGMLFLAPLLVSPFVVVYKVSILGQLIMYLIIFFVTLGTLWLSSFITMAIQTKLGESPRGNDIAKALTYAFALMLVVPVYGLMFLAPQMSQMMGSDLSVFFPFTWGADLVTWTIILFNGIGLSGSVISLFESVIGLPSAIDLFLLSVFTLATVALALLSADRIFRIVVGARTEKVTTVDKDGILIRGIKRVAPGSFGILLVTAVKDFTRKVQNTSEMIYGIALTLMLPLMIGTAQPDLSPELKFFLAALLVSMIMGMISTMTFSGIGFLDSQDQLWILRSAPNGAMKFVKARVVEGFLLSLIFSAIPPVIVSLDYGFGIVEMLGLFVIAYLSVCGGMLIGTGITASNPNYDDTKSSAFGVNRLVTLGIFMATYVALIVTLIAFRLFASFTFMLAFLTVPILIEGLVIVYIGVRKLSRKL
jgi:hypothetical protein